uniref:Putative secreted protein n=1 Tax=Ixodes ricinus TaxID=34613 RepID=A0A6B0UF67_IXORI
MNVRKSSFSKICCLSSSLSSLGALGSLGSCAPGVLAGSGPSPGVCAGLTISTWGSPATLCGKSIAWAALASGCAPPGAPSPSSSARTSPKASTAP